MPVEWRGLAPGKELGWIKNIEKENKLRLEWFRKNEERLIFHANKPLKHVIPQEVKENFEKEAVETVKHKTFLPRIKGRDPDPIDPRALHDLMLPIDQRDLKVLNRKEVDGRREYLKRRSKLLPEERYYLPENVNAIYGWNIFHYKAPNYGFGRWFNMKHSFYRTKGVHRDPDWYREPATYSPSICTA